jgi:hypothetical protein
MRLSTSPQFNSPKSGLDTRSSLDSPHDNASRGFSILMDTVLSRFICVAYGKMKERVKTREESSPFSTSCPSGDVFLTALDNVL